MNNTFSYAWYFCHAYVIHEQQGTNGKEVDNHIYCVMFLIAEQCCDIAVYLYNSSQCY